MKITRRQFVKGGVAAFTVTFAAPEFLSDLARAQGARVRNLVVLYLSGGNDALSMLVPYNDPFYYSRRPTIAVPAGNVLQIGTDSSSVALGLHPRLTGLRQIFDQGRLALIQRTGYHEPEPLAFSGHRHLVDGQSGQLVGPRLGRPLSRFAAVAGRSAGRLEHDARSAARAAGEPVSRCRRFPNPRPVRVPSPNTGAEAHGRARRRASASTRTCRSIGPQLAFVYGSAQAALATLDRVAHGRPPTPAPSTYPRTTAFGQALQAVAGAMVRGIGTKVFYVTTGGFDTHSGQNVNAANGTYFNLMATLNDGLFAFYNDLQQSGTARATRCVLTFSEFGRRISENGSDGTDHGAASVMMAMGGRVNGGLYGTAPALNPDPQQSDARKQRRRRPLRDRLPVGLRAGHRPVAGRRFASHPRGDFRRPGSPSSRSRDHSRDRPDPRSDDVRTAGPCRCS